MLLDHVGFSVSDIINSKEMYTKLLLPLGVTVGMEGYGHIGFGKDGKNFFWLGESDKENPKVSTKVHVAIIAESHEAVNAFYNEGIKAGFKDNGAPGLRTMYDPNYYAAFLLDNDGNNIEAVCRFK